MPTILDDTPALRASYQEHVWSWAVDVLPPTVGIVAIGFGMASAIGSVTTPLLITGPHDSGKSTLAQTVAEIAGPAAVQVAANATITTVRSAMTNALGTVLILDDVNRMSASRINDVVMMHVNRMPFSSVRSGKVFTQEPSQCALIVCGESPLSSESAAARMIELDLDAYPLRSAGAPAGAINAGSALRADLAKAVHQWARKSTTTNPLITPEVRNTDPRSQFARAEVLKGWTSLLGFLVSHQTIDVQEAQQALGRVVQTLTDLPASRTAPTRRGRPSTGEEVMARIPTQQLIDLDVYSEAHGLTRAEAIRKAIALLLNSL